MKQLSKIPIIVLVLTGSFVIMQSCEKKPIIPDSSGSPVISTPSAVLSVTTSEIRNIMPTGAVTGGVLTDDGGHRVTERGVVWGTAENPTVDNMKTSDGVGSGSFTSIITGLTENTLYYVRAYAVVGGVVMYGPQLLFRTTSPGEPGFPGIFRYDGTSFKSGNKKYFGLGSYPSSRDFWEYDLTTGTWKRLADHPMDGLTSATGFTVGTKVYVGTGWLITDYSMSNLNQFWEYDPETDKWLEIEPLPASGRGHAAGFSIGNKGYFGAGVYTEGIGGTGLSDFWEWDQPTNRWTRKADYPGSESPTVAFSEGTKGYFATSDLKEIWEWDQTTNLWKRIEKLP